MRNSQSERFDHIFKQNWGNEFFPSYSFTHVPSLFPISLQTQYSATSGIGHNASGRNFVTNADTRPTFWPWSCGSPRSFSSLSWRWRLGREFRWLDIQVFRLVSGWTPGLSGGRGMLEDLNQDNNLETSDINLREKRMFWLLWQTLLTKQNYNVKHGCLSWLGWKSLPHFSKAGLTTILGVTLQCQVVYISSSCRHCLWHFEVSDFHCVKKDKSKRNWPAMSMLMICVAEPYWFSRYTLYSPMSLQAKSWISRHISPVEVTVHWYFSPISNFSAPLYLSVNFFYFLHQEVFCMTRSLQWPKKAAAFPSLSNFGPGNTAKAKLRTIEFLVLDRLSCTTWSWTVDPPHRTVCRLPYQGILEWFLFKIQKTVQKCFLVESVAITCTSDNPLSSE